MTGPVIGPVTGPRSKALDAEPDPAFGAQREDHHRLGRASGDGGEFETCKKGCQDDHGLLQRERGTDADARAVAEGKVR